MQCRLGLEQITFQKETERLVIIDGIVQGKGIGERESAGASRGLARGLGCEQQQ